VLSGVGCASIPLDPAHCGHLEDAVFPTDALGKDYIVPLLQLPSRMKVPSKSLVMGSPGKVKRLLTHAEVAEIQQYADRYVQYRLDYMKPGAGQ
jgi:carbonic anhydrase/acetyltransferase-like protein (isoleucine patch superfamily)